MGKFTRRDFLKRSSVATSLLGVGSAVDLWATLEGEKSLTAGATLYVATNGNDDWSGKLAEPNVAKTDGPFATLERARDAVRELKGKQAPKEPITVTVRGEVLPGPDAGVQARRQRVARVSDQLQSVPRGEAASERRSEDQCLEAVPRQDPAM